MQTQETLSGNCCLHRQVSLRFKSYSVGKDSTSWSHPCMGAYAFTALSQRSIHHTFGQPSDRD